MRRLLKNSSAFTLIECLIAVAVIGIVALGIAQGLYYIHRSTQNIKDKAFAAQKLIQITEELRGLVADTQGSTIGVLDNYDNGTHTSPILTTRAEVTSQGDPISGNASGRFVRQINIVQIPNEPLARQVYVRIFYASSLQLVAETMSVMYTIQNAYVPSQIYDVYVLSLENVPGWWSALSTMKPTFDNMIQDLEGRNPGLVFRTHYITQQAYGRDPYYRPYINQTSYTDITASPYVYFYPGLMHLSSANFFYYVPSYFNGNMNVDGTATSGLYSEADEFNHGVRYPDEVADYNAAVAYATAHGLSSPQITWRMLLENMNTNPSAYKNLLLINLHAEMLPLPPMRNYSDAAKDPANNPNLRFVAHPEQLYYNTTTSSVTIRAYSYVAGPTMNGTSIVNSTPENTLISTATIILKGVVLGSSNISVQNVIGNSSSTYVWTASTITVNYNVSTSGSDTVITLYNSPVRQAYKTSSTTGLSSTSRLYGMEYIPCEVAGNSTFVKGTGDLTSAGNGPKNTARWRITFFTSAGFISSAQYTLEARIGSDITTGSSANEPSNLSRTYFWVGTSSPPATEQYQFLGDPRHMPYADVKDNNGYNWYGASSISGYSGFSKVNTGGWAGGPSGSVLFDAPRYFQLLRTGLLNTGGVWATISGWTFFYVGFGGEMGDDGHVGFTNGLPIMDRLWNPASAVGTLAAVNEIIDTTWANSATQVNPRLPFNTAKTWCALPGLGELYPDSDFTMWSTKGNLPSIDGTGTTFYYRGNYTDSSYFGFNPVKRTGQAASASFINGVPTGYSVTGNTYFNHESGSIGNITTPGTVVSSSFNFPLPNSINSGGNLRPFSLNDNSYGPPEWSDATYKNQRTFTSPLENYFDSDLSSSFNTSGTVSVTSGTSVYNIAVNGTAAQSNFGTAEIGKLTLITMLRGFMQAGNPSITIGAVSQIPLVTISTPTLGQQFMNPSSIPLAWTNAWARWDGQSYTSSYPVGYSPSTTMLANIKYTNDGGKHWYFIEDNTAATFGVYDGAHLEASPYTWSTPSATFPEGTYIVCVEEYRQGFALHYTYHERQLYIQR